MDRWSFLLCQGLSLLEVSASGKSGCGAVSRQGPQTKGEPFERPQPKCPEPPVFSRRANNQCLGGHVVRLKVDTGWVFRCANHEVFVGNTKSSVKRDGKSNTDPGGNVGVERMLMVTLQKNK